MQNNDQLPSYINKGLSSSDDELDDTESIKKDLDEFWSKESSQNKAKSNSWPLNLKDKVAYN